MFAYARQIRAMNLRDLLIWRCRAAGRNINDQMAELRRFARRHDPLFCILRHGLIRKSSLVVYQFHGYRHHFEREIAFVTNDDRSSYVFTVSATSITCQPK